MKAVDLSRAGEKKSAHLGVTRLGAGPTHSSRDLTCPWLAPTHHGLAVSCRETRGPGHRRARASFVPSLLLPPSDVGRAGGNLERFSKECTIRNLFVLLFVRESGSHKRRLAFPHSPDSLAMQKPHRQHRDRDYDQQQTLLPRHLRRRAEPQQKTWLPQKKQRLNLAHVMKPPIIPISDELADCGLAERGWARFFCITATVDVHDLTGAVLFLFLLRHVHTRIDKSLRFDFCDFFKCPIR